MTEVKHQSQHGDNEEWCFVAWVDGREVMRIPRTKLGIADGTGGDDCADYLLNGLAILFDQSQVRIG